MFTPSCVPFLKILIAVEMPFLLIICMYTCMLSSGFSLISGDHFTPLAELGAYKRHTTFHCLYIILCHVAFKTFIFSNYNFRVGAVNLQTNLPCLLLAV